MAVAASSGEFGALSPGARPVGAPAPTREARSAARSSPLPEPVAATPIPTLRPTDAPAVAATAIVLPTLHPTAVPTPASSLTPTPAAPPKIVPENADRVAELRSSKHRTP